MASKKIMLDEEEIPKQWYNILADIKMNPPLGPDGQPVSPDMLAPVFPMNLIEQEVPRAEAVNHDRALEILRESELNSQGASLILDVVVFDPAVETDLTNTGDMLEYGLTGATDFSIPPTAATVEMGEEILDGVADYLARFVVEFQKIEIRPLVSLKK